MVCNPTTRQVIYLPEEYRFHPSKFKCYMYLGYDSSNDQYKVLRIIRQPSINIFYEESLYSFGCKQSSSFTWRRVKNGISVHTPISQEVYINGVVYYVALFSSLELVSFDFVSELFNVIKLPDERLVGLSNYQGKFGGFRYLGSNSYSLWVLDDVKNQIWSNMSYVFPQSLWNLELSFSRTTNVGELVFVSKDFSGDSWLLFYDLKKNVTRRVKIEEVTKDGLGCISKNISHFLMSCDHIENIIRF